MLGGKSMRDAGECPAKTKLFGEESEGTWSNVWWDLDFFRIFNYLFIIRVTPKRF